MTNLKEESKLLQGEIADLDREKENLKLREEEVTALESRISQKRSEFEVKSNLRREVELEISSIEKSLEEKRKLEQEVEKTKIHLLSKRELLSAISREEEELKKFILDQRELFDESAYQKLVLDVQKKKDELEKLNSRKVDMLTKISFLNKEKEDLISKKERVFKIDVCPTCLQDVSELHKHNILNETESRLASIKKNLEALEIESAKFNEMIHSCKNQLSSLEDNRIKFEVAQAKQEQLIRAKSKLSEMSRQKDLLIKDRDLLINHLESTKEQITKYFYLDSLYKAKSFDLRKAIEEERNSEIELAEIIRELELSLIHI